MHPGNYGPLTAFDVSSGKVAWTAGGDAFFMAPIVVTLQGIRQVVSVTQAAVVGVAADNGRLSRPHGPRAQTAQGTRRGAIEVRGYRGLNRAGVTFTPGLVTTATAQEYQLARSMTRKPASLTEIAKRNGGQFPTELVFRTIDGGNEPTGGFERLWI